jgi:carboxypeptidase C (cathepsin A)
MKPIMKTGLAAMTLASLALAGAAVASAQEAADGFGFFSEHTGTFNGERVRYRAAVDDTVIETETGAPAVRFVSTAYTRLDVEDRAGRPVIFLFNGGPSVASMWLHMGAFGPVRIDPPEDVTAPVPQTDRPVPNPYTVLDVADLVFIDPPGAGFSEILDAADSQALHTVSGDAGAVARFVEVWSREHGREASPKYVVGESYGTIRGAVMAGLLSESMPLDGLILLGQAVNMIETSQRAQNTISYATNLSALAAIAAFHGEAETDGRSIAEFVDDVHAYAMTTYLDALVRGNELSEDARVSIARQLEAMTGIDAAYYLENQLRITKRAFVMELLADEGLMLDMYDARYSGPVPEEGSRGSAPYGPVLDLLPLALETHFSETLGVTLDFDDYAIRAPHSGDWIYEPTGGMGGPFDDFNYDASIAQAMEANDDFMLMIGTGIYDTTTTLGPARYLAAQAGYDRDRIVLREYEGGHMAYTNEAVLERLTDDVRALVSRD